MSDRVQRDRWWVGVAAALGVMSALSLLPRTRNTAVTQLVLAAGHQPEWMRAAYARPDGRPEPRIERELAAHPKAVELHVGAATLPSFVSVGTEADPEVIAAMRRRSTSGILSRLERVAERFPDSPVVRAHQLRYLCNDAVVIRRAEEQQVDPSATRLIGPARPGQPAAGSLRVFRATAAAGQRLEPRNGFFDTMLAVAAFAARRDKEGLRHLRRAAAKPIWDDHSGQERQPQWTLLERAYGDRGWLQKIPAGLTAFDARGHYRAITSAVNLALWHAWQQERAKRPDRLRAIRRDVMQLGLRLQATPETQRLGLVLFDAGSHRIPKDNGPWYILDHQKLRKHLRAPYLNYLKRHGESAEIEWVLAKSRQTEAGWGRINEIDHASNNGPVWADMWLGVGWAGGLMLLKQGGWLMLFWAGVWLLGQFIRRDGSALAAERGVALFAYALVFLSPVIVLAAIGPDYDWPGTLEAGLTAFALVLLGAVWLSIRLRNRVEREGVELAAGAWIALFLTATLAPLYLIALYGPISLMWGYLGGVVVVGVVAAMGTRHGKRNTAAHAEGRAWLNAALAVVGTVLSLGLAMPLLLRSDGLARMLQVYPLDSPAEGLIGVVPMVMLLPAALLVYLQLCRVAALRLPLVSGVLRGLRHTTPRAIALLAALYLIVLVPTVAAERVVEEQLTGSVAGGSF